MNEPVAILKPVEAIARDAGRILGVGGNYATHATTMTQFVLGYGIVFYKIESRENTPR